MKAGPAFRESQAEIFFPLPTQIYRCCSSRIPCNYWWNESPIFRGITALIANLQFMTTFSLYIYIYIYIHTKWGLRLKFSVRGVRQMNCNEIPDIWQMAVRRFSRVQSMPSCLYKLYRAHWTEGSRCRIAHMMNWGCIQSYGWKVTQLFK